MTTAPLPSRFRERPAFSVPAIVAGVAAGLIFFTEGFDLLLAIAAIGCGLVGVVMALAPSVRGGVVSVASVLIGLGAIAVTFLQIIF